MKNLKVVIAGSRTITDYQHVVDAIKDSGIKPLIAEIVSGGCSGVDKLGELFAEAAGLPIKRFKPDWSRGKCAGPLRNLEMAKYADYAIIIYDGKSKGSSNMIKCMKDLNKPVFVKIVDE